MYVKDPCSDVHKSIHNHASLAIYPSSQVTFTASYRPYSGHLQPPSASVPRILPVNKWTNPCCYLLFNPIFSMRLCLLLFFLSRAESWLLLSVLLLSSSCPPLLFIVLEFLRVISSFVSDRLWILVDIEFQILISRTYITSKSRWAVIIQLTADLVLLDYQLSSEDDNSEVRSHYFVYLSQLEVTKV